jgi:hypothetical protein
MQEGKTTLPSLLHTIDAGGGGGHYEVYVSLLKHQIDPSLYPGDIFVQANQRLPIPLVRIVYPLLLKSTGVEINFLFFLGELSSRLLLFASIYFLSLSLFKDPPIALLTSAMMLIPKVAIGFFALYNRTDFNADLALGLNIFSLAFFFQERMGAALLLNGLSYNFHPIIPFWLTTVYAVYFLLQRTSWKRLSQGAIIFLVSSFPFTLLMVKNLAASHGVYYDTGLWLRFFMTSHIWPSLQTAVDPRFWMILALYPFISALALTKYPVENRLRKKIVILTAVVTGAILLAVVFCDLDPWMAVIKTMPARSSVYLIVLSLPLISRLLWMELLEADREKRVYRRNLTRTVILLLGVSMLLTPFYYEPVWVPYLLSSVLFFISRPPGSPLTPGPNGRMTKILLGFLCALPCALILRHGLQAENTPPLTDWKEVQVWVKDHSHKEDMFITPPDLCGFRIFSERINFISTNDLMSILALDPAFTQECASRMRWLGFEPLQDLDTIRRTYGIGHHRLMEGFRRLQERDFVNIQKHYPSVRYLVTFDDVRLNLPKLFENRSFAIYAISRPRGT